MARLRYTVLTSLDGYVNDAEGGFSWAEPTDELHDVVNALEREVGTHLLRPPPLRDDALPGRPCPATCPARWGSTRGSGGRPTRSSTHAPSRTSRPPAPGSSAAFDPLAVQELKARACSTSASGGPTLAVEAFRADLVDDVHLFVHPYVVGGGTRALPDDIRLALELVAVDRIGEAVHLHYRVRR